MKTGSGNRPNPAPAVSKTALFISSKQHKPQKSLNPFHSIESTSSSYPQKSSFVNVCYDIRIIDHHGNKLIPHDLPLDELECLQEIVDIKENIDPSCPIIVSPPRSAHSETAIHVEIFISAIHKRLRNEMEDEFNTKLSQMEERVVRRVKNEMKKEMFMERTLSSLLLRRNIEDFALQQMAGMMGFEYLSSRTLCRIRGNVSQIIFCGRYSGIRVGSLDN